MILKVEDSLFQIEPAFKIGLIHYTKISVTSSPQMLKGRLQLFQEQLFFDLAEKAVTDFPGIKEWRALWKKFGADPNRYRPSMEAMYRRIAKQNYITSLHSAVDLNNFFSMRYEMPMGIYDLDKTEGDIIIALGDETTSYIGLNGRENKLQNILTIQDIKGAFGSPFVDSERTAVTEETTNALHILFLPPSMDEEKGKALLSSIGTMFNQINGGKMNYALLSNEKKEWKSIT